MTEKYQQNAMTKKRNDPSIEQYKTLDFIHIHQQLVSARMRCLNFKEDYLNYLESFIFTPIGERAKKKQKSQLGIIWICDKLNSKFDRNEREKRRFIDTQQYTHRFEQQTPKCT